MSKNPSNVPFSQPDHGKTGTTTAKNKGKLGFSQPKHGTGKTSTKKNPGKLGFTQKTAAMTGNSTKKNPGKASFVQPAKGGSAPMPKADGSAAVANAKSTKMKGSGKPVAPKTKALKKYKSIDSVVDYRKKTYGV